MPEVIEQATPGTVVNLGALITPGGAQGPPGAQGASGSGTGDMLKSVYDVNGDNVVDNAAAVPWAGVTGKPATFPPSTHGSTHVGGAADAIPVATTTVAGLAPAKPNAGVNATTTQVVMGDDTRLTDARIPNSTLAHQASHVSGSDQIPSASTSVRGLMPVANNVANNFYASDGTQKQPTYAMLGGTQPAPIVHAPSHKSGGSDAIALDTLAAPTDITTLNASTSAHGLMPKASGSATTFYGSDNTQKAVLYSALSGTPSSFAPAAHASSHKSGQVDVIKLDELGPTTDVATLNATTSAHGLLPKLDNVATHYLNGQGLWVPSVPDFVNTRIIFDDFLGVSLGPAIPDNTWVGRLPWLTSIVGAGATVTFDDQYANATTKAFGCIACNTGTTATGYAAILAASIFPSLGALEMDFRILAAAAPSSAQNYTLQLGLTDSAGTHYVYFNITFSASAVATGKCANGGTASTTATAAFTGAAFHRYQMLINAAWTSITFFQDGTQIGSALTTNIPTATAMFPLFKITKTNGTTAVIANIDQLYLSYSYAS